MNTIQLFSNITFPWTRPIDILPTNSVESTVIQSHSAFLQEYREILVTLVPGLKTLLYYPDDVRILQ